MVCLSFPVAGYFSCCSTDRQSSRSFFYLLRATHIMGTKTLRVISWMVRGLNDRMKRSMALQYLKTQAPDIVILQETHLTGSKVLLLLREVGWDGPIIPLTRSTRGGCMYWSDAMPPLLYNVCNLIPMVNMYFFTALLTPAPSLLMLCTYTPPV